MKKHALALIASLGVSLSASAMTIDFTEFATDYISGPVQVQNIASPFQSKGFTFATTHQQFYVWSKTDTRNADQGGATMMGHETITMTQTSGAPFSLYSIDMDDSASSPKGTATGNTAPHPIKFTFYYVGGTTSEKTVYLDAIGGLQTFVFSEYNLLKVEWQHTSSYSGYTIGSQFDNVKVNVDCGTK